MEVFGAPSSEQAVRPGFAGTSVADCAVTWKQIGLRVVFTTLGFNPGACNPDKQVWTASVTSKQWRTGSGVRISDPKSRIFKVNRNATLRNGIGWVLFTKYWPFGPNSPTRTPSVAAKISQGRIVAFNLYIDAQGE
jgi:hypothetical protein